MLVTPDSMAMICWVRSATRTASSVGSASASSKELVCSDWVPPSTAGQRLDRGADDVVERLLGGQRDAGGLGVEAQPHRLLALGAVGLAHLPRPDPARRAVLGDLLEEVDVGVEEEGEPRGEVVDVEAALDRPLDVGEAVLEREGELLLGGRAGLADVVAGDRDRVPARHVARCTTRSCR